MPYTYDPATVYAPVDGSNNPRGAVMGEAQTLAIEMAAKIESKAEATALAAETNARQVAVAGEAAARAAGDLSVMSALGARIDALENSTREGVIVFATKADMDSDLDYDENTEARVYTDPLPANNGIYRKVGASGSGSWNFLRAIDDYSFSLTMEVGSAAKTVAGIDVARKSFSAINRSAAATIAIDVTGVPASLGSPTSIILPPGIGVFLGGADCPLGAISAVSSHDGVPLALSFTSASGDDPTIDAFVANFSTPPSAPRKAAIAALRGGLLSAGILQKMDGLWLLAAANADAASVNWTDGSKTLTTSGAPTFTTDRGYTGDATDAELDTGVSLPAANYKRTHASMACWVRDTDTSLAQFTMGFGAGGIIANRSLTTWGGRPNTNGNQTPAKPSGAGGFFAWSRLDDANYTAYWNDTYQQTEAVAAVASINGRNLLGLALNGASGPTAHSSHQLAFMAAGAGLTEAEMLTLHALVRNYLSAVGAI